jgi:hypothetical protein
MDRWSVSSVVPEGQALKKVRRNGKRQTSFFFPQEKPLELLFFRKIYSKLQERLGSSSTEDKGIPVAFFQRAIARLYKILDVECDLNMRDYDSDNNGSVDWPEFCKCWRKSKIMIRFSTLERIHVTLDSSGVKDSRLAQFLSNFIMFVIFVSSISFILSTLLVLRLAPDDDPDGPLLAHPVFGHLEFACVLIFSVEYVCRLSTAHATRLELLDQNSMLSMLIADTPLVWETSRERLTKFVLDPSNVIDILAILPWYMERVLPLNANLTFLRMVRLTRVLRVLRINSIQDAVDTLAKTLAMSASSLYVLCFYIVLGVIISSSLIYFCEQGEWAPDLDDEFSNARGTYQRKTWDGELDRSPFTSIPKAIWFVIVTVTTVGYGDINLITNTGRLVGTLTIVGGAVAFAMPIGVISSNFARVWEDKEKDKADALDFIKKEAQTVFTELSMGNRFAELVFEVYDDTGLGTAPLLLGQAVAPLNLLDANLSVEKPTGTTLTLGLQPSMLDPNTEDGSNKEIEVAKVQGSLNVTLLWVPENHPPLSETQKQGMLLRKQTLNGARPESNNEWDVPEIPSLTGELVVGVVSAADLWCSDKEVGFSDPFCRLTLYTRRDLPPETWETQVIDETHNPQWNETRTFLLDWRGGKSVDKASGSRQVTRQSLNSQNSLGSESSTDLAVPHTPDDQSFNRFGVKLVTSIEKEVDFWKEKYQALYKEAPKTTQGKLPSHFQALYDESLVGASLTKEIYVASDNEIAV